MNSQVSIIILNWNSPEDTIECLESLYQIDYHNYNVILVDNASSDDSIEKIKEYCEGNLKVKSSFFKYNLENKPISILELTEAELNTTKRENKFFSLPSNKKLILIKNDKNYGFAEGNNIGIRYALEKLKSDYILLLNDDITVHNDFLSELVEFTDNNQGIGIAGPTVYYYDKPDKVAYGGLKVNVCNGKITHPDLEESEKNLFRAKNIDYVAGCGLLIKKNVINDIGLLDSCYFLYYEDADWCLRAKKKGYNVCHVPESKIWHKIPPIENKPLISFYYGNRNSFLLMKKNCSKINILFCYPRFIIVKFIFSIVLLLKGKGMESLMVIRAIYDVIRGNYGYKRFS